MENFWKKRRGRGLIPLFSTLFFVCNFAILVISDQINFRSNQGKISAALKTITRMELIVQIYYSFFVDLGVNLRRRNVDMAKHFLNCSDVGAVF